MTSSKASILVIDDEPDLRLLYELTLLREGYAVECADTVAQARALLAQNRYDVVLTDMRLPDGLGIEILQELQQSGRSERCIVVTAYGSAENAVEALRAGAFDYLSKPVELKQLRVGVASAVQGQPSAGAAPESGLSAAHKLATSSAPSSRQTPPVAAAKKLSKGQKALCSMAGSSSTMQSLKERIVKVARSMAPVHIHGESGTGKELVARAIHANSQRADGPLVAVNCGAIPENLLEAEFFGAKKGSFTGASADREGFFQAASGGTLFLDEIGDLPLSMQTKLLRAIQERKVRSLGSTQEEVVDVRLVSATHKNLAQEVEANRFRQDLYYRLNVIALHTPALRERREDLPELVEALLGKLCTESGIETPELAADFLPYLMQQGLPGNVRELENLLHRALALSDGIVLSASNIEDADSHELAANTHPFAAPQPAAPSAAHASASTAALGHAPQTGTAPGNASQEDAESAANAPAQLPSLPLNLQTWLDAQERKILLQALQANHNNRTAAAAQLGLNLRQMRYRIERLGITLSGERTEP